jgi:hypothetical protein
MTDLPKEFSPNSTFCDVQVHAEPPDAEPDEAQAVLEQHDVPAAADDLPAPDCGVPLAPRYGGPRAQDYASPVRDYESLAHDLPLAHAWSQEPHYEPAHYSVCWRPSHAKDWLSYSPDDKP